MMYELFLKMNSHALYQVEGKRLLPGESLWQTDMKRGSSPRGSELGGTHFDCVCT